MAFVRQRDATVARERLEASGVVRTGIAPVDERVGALRAGGCYLLAGVPGSGRSAFVLQFLAEGLKDGRAALITSASRERVFDEAGHWGVDLESAWREGRFRLLSYKEDFQRRLLAAAEPYEVLEEMGQLLGHGLERVAIYPATPLWETRAGTALARNFLRWTDAFQVTTLATIGGDLEGPLSPASEWVAEAVQGVFLLERRANGLHQVSVRRMSPPRPDPGAITLDLVPEKGFVAPADRLTRRATDPSAGSEKRVLMLRLDEEVPEELEAWLGRWYEAETVTAPLTAVERARRGGFGLVLIYLSQSTVKEAMEALRVIGGLTTAPIVLATADPVRSTDRTRALEAGATDFLSSPLSVSELASRVEKALIAGASFRPRNGGDPSGEDRRPGRAAAGGDPPVTERSFAEGIAERLESPRGSLFSFVAIPVAAPHAEGLRLGEVLLQEVREAAGDVVGEIPGGYGVVLAGTDMGQAGAFLARVRNRLGEAGPSISPEVLSGALHADRIRRAVGAEGS